MCIQRFGNAKCKCFWATDAYTHRDTCKQLVRGLSLSAYDSFPIKTILFSCCGRGTSLTESWPQPETLNKYLHLKFLLCFRATTVLYYISGNNNGSGQPTLPFVFIQRSLCPWWIELLRQATRLRIEGHPTCYSATATLVESAATGKHTQTHIANWKQEIDVWDGGA